MSVAQKTLFFLSESIYCLLFLGLFYYFYAQTKQTMEQLEKAHKKLAEAVAQLERATKSGQLLNIDRDIILSKIAYAYDTIQAHGTATIIKMPQVAPETQTPTEHTQAVELEEPKITIEVKDSPQPVVAPEPTKAVTNEPQIVAVQEKAPIVEVEPEKKAELKKSVVDSITKPINKQDTEQQKVLDLAQQDKTKATPKVQPHDSNTSEILSDKFKDNKKLINEQIGMHSNRIDMATHLQNKRITDLSKAIGINDKFLFIKELFDGNSEEYSATIKKLNSLTDLNEAIIYLHENFNWSSENTSATKLFDLVRRKFL